MTTQDASKRGRRNRAKGGRYEAEIARRFTAANVPATKHGFKQRRAQDTEPDVTTRCFALECKDAQRLKGGLHGVLAEAGKRSGRKVPAVVWKHPRVIRDGKVTHQASELVALPLADFLAMAVIFERVLGDAAALQVVDTAPVSEKREPLALGGIPVVVSEALEGSDTPFFFAPARLPQGAGGEGS